MSGNGNVATSSGIGISNLPNQRHRSSARKGARLTLMVVGTSGLGKTTFVNSLFTTSILSRKEYTKSKSEKSEKGDKSEPTTRIKVTEAELEEKGFRLNLKVIDTPGFGDYVNNNNCWTPIVDYIDAQYSAYFNNEMQAHRDGFVDPRVHACLYFIEPTGHSLKTIDIVSMKQIGTRVNLIPVIGRADSITHKDMRAFKARIQEEILTHEIPIYRPPLESEDEENTKQNQELHDSIPFGIIGSESFVGASEDKKVRGRQYPWGVAEVENDAHCDFKKLRRLLLRSHLLDIIVNTDAHYENFRNKQLERGGLVDGMTPERMLKDLEVSSKKKRAAIDEKYQTKINQEDARIKELSANLDKKKDDFNNELEQKKQALEALKEELKQLQEKLNSPTKKK